MAAKRIASAHSLESNIEDAARQIRSWTGRGIVALNVDQITAFEDGARAGWTVSRLASDAYKTLERLGALGPISGVFTFGSVIHRRADGIPTLSYDFGMCFASLNDAHSHALDTWWTSVGTRARLVSERLFDEALGLAS